MTASGPKQIHLVVHGHFYQPPREDPWTGEVPRQPTAAPFHDWNERITAECYRPNTVVGVAGDPTASGPGDFVVNLFEHLSFNVGPTLLSWLEPRHPDVYARIIAADRRTGRAIAQAYGHAILPLCDERDLRTQVRWGIVDFRHRFGREPEGMWMPETAVSDEVLVALAEEGIRFTIVAPGQISAIRPLGSDDDAWLHHGFAPHEGLGPLDPDDDLDPVPLDVTRAYRWCHPTDPHLGVDLVVYDGALAHALAFARPTSENIVEAALTHTPGSGGLVSAATDGETFGHHHKGAEHDVAHALTVGAPANGIDTPRIIDLLASEPPTHEARVRVSAWSCAHGVGRWSRDCGCETGGQPGWSQAWRTPLRAAFDVLRDWGVEVMERRGRELFHDPWAARDAYLEVLIGATSWDRFVEQHVTGDPHPAGLLLDAQRNALLMYTSCGWFFNDVGGIETVQVLRYAARAIDLYEQLGEVPPVDEVLALLGKAESNDPEIGDGRLLWFDEVLPR